MARCRIYLFTYKRDHLLPRAVKSLRDQTFTDWICEVHNDCPDDPFPSAFINSLNDERFILKPHAVNLGPIASFNLAFAGCAEPYASILEDDNWWQPDFLQEMIAVMEHNPTVNVAWSNMTLWREQPGGTWINTGKTIWQETQLRFFEWPHPKQAYGALHSNGAMVYRGSKASKYLVPSSILFNAVELIRERCYEHPIYLHSRPLANFAITLATNRSTDPYPWIAAQTMLLASFVATAPEKNSAMKQTLEYQRRQRPVPTVICFLANIFLLKENRFYQLFTIKDWLVVAKWLAGNSHKLNYMKRYLASQSETYQFLLNQTRLRYAENNPDIQN